MKILAQDSPSKRPPLYFQSRAKTTFQFQDIIPFGNHWMFRYLLGWLMPPEVALLKLTQPEAVTKLYDKAHVIQDMLVPVEHLEKSIDVFHKEFEVRNSNGPHLNF